MEAKEKAKELFKKHFYSIPYSGQDDNEETAKDACLITINEILDLDAGDSIDVDFWLEVRKHVELLC